MISELWNPSLIIFRVLTQLVRDVICELQNPLLTSAHLQLVRDVICELQNPLLTFALPQTVRCLVCEVQNPPLTVSRRLSPYRKYVFYSEIYYKTHH